MFKKNNDIPAINDIVFSCIPNLPTDKYITHTVSLFGGNGG